MGQSRAQKGTERRGFTVFSREVPVFLELVWESEAT